MELLSMTAVPRRNRSSGKSEHQKEMIARKCGDVRNCAHLSAVV